MKEETLAVWYEGRNCYYPVEHESVLPSPSLFFRGCCRASYPLCLFLSLSISFIVFTLRLAPFLPPSALPAFVLGLLIISDPWSQIKLYPNPPPPPLSSIYCMGVKINNTPFSDLTHLIWHLIQSWVICRGDINEFFHAPAPHLLFCCVPPLFSGSRAIYMRSEVT